MLSQAEAKRSTLVLHILKSMCKCNDQCDIGPELGGRILLYWREAGTTGWTEVARQTVVRQTSSGNLIITSCSNSISNNSSNFEQLACPNSLALRELPCSCGPRPAMA